MSWDTINSPFHLCCNVAKISGFQRFTHDFFCAIRQRKADIIHPGDEHLCPNETCSFLDWIDGSKWRHLKWRHCWWQRLLWEETVRIFYITREKVKLYNTELITSCALTELLWLLNKISMFSWIFWKTSACCVSLFDTRSIGLIDSFKRNTKVGLLFFHLTADR